MDQISVLEENLSFEMDFPANDDLTCVYNMEKSFSPSDKQDCLLII